jgi:hypothetical protein
METKKNQNQVYIAVNSEETKQKLPLNLIIPMVAGAITGTAIIIAIMIGIKMLLGL